MLRYYTASLGYLFLPILQTFPFLVAPPTRFLEELDGAFISTTHLSAGKGFGQLSSDGKKKKIVLEKTYGEEQLQPVDEIFDKREAMEHFFTTNMEWAPLFQCMVAGEGFSSFPAMSFLGSGSEDNDSLGSLNDLQFHEETPWKKLEAIPSDPDCLSVLSSFLDSVQQTLVDIPVDEATKGTDDLDMHFIMEGKRMLAISRFHVLNRKDTGSGGRTRMQDELFATCWSEIAELRRANEFDTGSIILLPDYDILDVKRFVDMNILRPLDWMGLSTFFEISSFERGVAAIRLLHKLSDIPTDEELAVMQK